MGSDLKIGSVITIKKDMARYRVVSIMPKTMVLCRMDTTKFDLTEISKASVYDMLSSQDIRLESNDDHHVVDHDKFSPVVSESFERKRAVFTDVKKIYGPDYMGLYGKKYKPEMNDILKKHSMSKSSFWRSCTRYFQSGLNDLSLVDGRSLEPEKHKKYIYKAKPGRKSEHIKEIGVVLDENVKEYFNEAIKDYKSGRQKSLRSAYDKMNNIHFTRVEIINGRTEYALLPVTERPTMKQFYNYANKHISKEEKDIIKTSQMEYRNNKRLLTSDSLYGVAGPGDMVEIDACEADVSLVSSLNRNQSVGRPIVYFMIDVYTRVILAVSISFDNNSLLGITSLFLNLAEDKKEFCSKYGINYEDDRLWPSCIIPARIRVDRGAEFKSKEFGRICLALGIEKDIVPGGSGSLKGVVEQSFHQMHSKQNVHLEGRGLIEKRHDSKHHEEATLTLDEYTKMVINFILTHNQQYMETYPITKDMIEKKVRAIPAELWVYGIESCVSPRPVQSKDQYMFDLMTPIKAKVTRKGIEYKGLRYISDDPYLAKCMIKAGNKRIAFEARMDMRSVGAVYYLSGNDLIKAPLNERLTGNADYKHMTMKQWDDYLKEKNRLKVEGRVYNEELSAYNYLTNESLVAEAASHAPETATDKKHMRPARENEKQRVSSDNRIEKRLWTDEEALPTGVCIETEENEPETGGTYAIEEILNMTDEERHRIMLEENRKAIEDFKDSDL